MMKKMILQLAQQFLLKMMRKLDKEQGTLPIQEYCKKPIEDYFLNVRFLMDNCIELNMEPEEEMNEQLKSIIHESRAEGLKNISIPGARTGSTATSENT